MRSTWLRITPWLALVFTILVLPSNAIMILTIVSWPVFLLTFAAVAAVPIARTGAAERAAGAERRGGGWTKAGVLSSLVVGQVLLSWAVLATARESAKSPISASNLRGIDCAIDLYCKSHGQPPPSLTALVQSGLSTPGQVVGLDGVQEGFTDGEMNTSYVYLPDPADCSEDGRRVVAYEKEACAPLACAVLFRRYGRWVLFGDGHVDRLADAEFQEALQVSQRRNVP